MKINIKYKRTEEYLSIRIGEGDYYECNCAGSERFTEYVDYSDNWSKLETFYWCYACRESKPFIDDYDYSDEWRDN